MYVFSHTGNVMVMTTVEMAQMKNFASAWMLPVSHHSASVVGITAASTAMSCATSKMIVVMEVMRKKKLAENLLPNLAQLKNSNAEMESAFRFTMYATIMMIAETSLMN